MSMTAQANADPNADRGSGTAEAGRQRPLRGLKRTRLVLVGFLVVFSAVGIRLGQLTIGTPQAPDTVALKPDADIPRPEIVDRSGRLLATNIEVASLFADPRKIIDVDEATELLTSHLPGLDAGEVRRKLSQRKRAFVWLKREVSPAEQAMIHNLGIPGVGFRKETRRVYPMGRLAAHTLGFVDVDSRGLAGIEHFLDGRGRLFAASLTDPSRDEAAPVELAMDVRVQHALAEELSQAKEKFSAEAAAGLVLDIRTGEILAMASLPDFNPNDPVEALRKDRINRITGGVYEMGSTFKTVTLAMALDEGVTDLNGTYDASAPLVIGRQRIRDYHGKYRVLTVPEVFIYSSNIGTAKMAFDVGEERQKAFLEKLGFFDRFRAELPEAAAPLLPPRWGKVTRATVAFGHGISVQPLQLAAAGAAFMNGGKLIPPTFLKRDREVADGIAKQVISPETSRKMRYLLRLNVEKGSASHAKVEGYDVGGKTGTAEKVVDGRYAKDQRFTNFLGGFPMNDPRYCVLIILDNPQPLPETYGYATAGWNAVPTGGKVIARIAPLLGVEPKFDDGDDMLDTMATRLEARVTE
mgnify:CR=1 FL=1